MTPSSGVGGWWLASDGRWYPPETHPDRAEDAPAADTPTPSGPAPTGAAPAVPRAIPATAQTATAVPDAFASAPLPGRAQPAPLPPGVPKRKLRPAGSGTWLVVAVVVVVIVAVVGGAAYLTVANGKPAPLPKHLPVPAFPTVPSHSGSVSAGQSPASTGAFSGSTGSSPSASPGPAATPTTTTPASAPAAGGGSGCTPDPSGGCISAGQPCSSSQANMTETGPGGSFVCTQRKIVSNGGGVLPVGYWWQSA